MSKITEILIRGAFLILAVISLLIVFDVIRAYYVVLIFPSFMLLLALAHSLKHNTNVSK